MNIAVVWECPEADFKRWNRDTQGGQCPDYAAYLRVGHEMKQALRREGVTVQVVRHRYAELLSWLSAHGLDNNPGNRARAHMEIWAERAGACGTR